jgi:type IV pilus assembly protein PilA
MFKLAKERLDREDEGFTLIELMVVVLIIAILLAIAIPTFLSARNSANARAAQSNLRNALTNEQSQFTSTQGFGDATTMTGVDSALQWVTAAPTAGNIVSVLTGDAASGSALEVELSAFSKDGTCLYVVASDDPSNSYTGYAVVPQSSNACTAPATVPTLATPTAGSATAHPGTAGSAPGTFYTGW